MYPKSKLFRTQIVLQLFLIAIVYWFSFDLTFQAIFCGVLLSTVGIPHGANDHLYRSDMSIHGMIKFLGVYLGMMLLYVIAWYFVPLMALILFFAISFHHFGQSNFENESTTYLPSWLWGMWVLVLPVLLHLKEATAIFEQMLFSNQVNVLSVVHDQSMVIGFNWPFIVVMLLGTLYLISLFIFERKNSMLYTIQFAVITLWYVFTPLLSGFIVVFCLWHALQSLQHQAITFQQTAGGTLMQFIGSMLPFSLVALFSFGVYLYFRDFKLGEAFILLSIITLPHVLIMHRLYHKTNNPMSIETN